jgi:hypothetical protein
VQEGASVVAFRRVDDRGGLGRIIGGRRRYEVAMSDGTIRQVSFGGLDSLLDARHNPADFWACVHAADNEREHLGDQETPRMVTWPSGSPQG